MDELNYCEITERMKQIRKEKHVTQEQIAQALDCTVAFVSNVENNRTKLNLRMLSYYSKICNVPMEVFLNAGSEKKADNENVSIDVISVAGKNGAEMPDPNQTICMDKSQDAELLDIFHTYSPAEQQKIIHCLRYWKS